MLYINKTGQNKFSFSSYDDHYQIAGSLLKGCQQHWKESITRIAKNSTVVPPNRQTYFRHLISLLSKVNKIEDFNAAVHTIVTEFPVTTTWLNWWLKAEHSRMLFPAVQIAIGDDKSASEHLQGFIHSFIN